MFAVQFEAAIKSASVHQFFELGRLLWVAHGHGQLSDDEAEKLSGLLEVRKAAPRAAVPARGRTGSRPRTDASLERRRRWAAAGRLPPQLQAQFTLGEAAVLAVVSSEVAKSGDCRLPLAAVAALAGVGKTTVRKAFDRAEVLGLVTVEERRASAWVSLTNVVRIVSREWIAWLRLRPKGGGSSFVDATNTGNKKGLPGGAVSVPFRGPASALEVMRCATGRKERRRSG